MNGPAPRFYCQLDYPDIPFPAPDAAQKSVATSGCGVCCASMVVENLTPFGFPPEAAARLALQCGARDRYGTNYYIYAPAFAEKFGLSARHTPDAGEMADFLRAGRGLAVANIRGDREGYIGVFSDGGHYVTVSFVRGDTAGVWDPMYRPGRYDLPGRAGKVRMEGQTALCDVRVLRDDCFEREYFLFARRDGGR